jgi:hypothetical protein
MRSFPRPHFLLASDFVLLRAGFEAMVMGALGNPV